MSLNNFDYYPPPTLDEYMCSPALARFVIGPLGSAKTTANIMELVRRMVEQEPDEAGVRPTRFAIIRNTLPQLKQTVLPDIQQFLSNLLRYKVAESTLIFDFPLEDGTRVKSEWLMVPLDSKEDTRRLLSLQLTGAWISEFRETDYDIVAAILGRVGRYPSRARVKPTWEGLIAESNPFSEGSPWYDHLVLDLPDHWAFFKQPGGLEPNAENVENLPDAYYARLIQGNGEEWVNVHVNGQFGDDMSGQAVFGSSFETSFHTNDTIVPNPTSPLMIGADWGRTPALLIGQVDSRGRLNIFKELLGVGIGIEKFATTVLIPTLYEEFAGMRYYIIGDPSGDNADQIGEESIFEVLRRLGFSAAPAPTNDIATRLRAVERVLNKQIDGGGALQIHSTNCPTLLRALQHEYKYRRKKTGDIEDKPTKDHPWSDVVDALQYMAMGINSPAVARMLKPRRVVQEVKISPAGWT